LIEFQDGMPNGARVDVGELGGHRGNAGVKTTAAMSVPARVMLSWAARAMSRPALAMPSSSSPTCCPSRAGRADLHPDPSGHVHRSASVTAGHLSFDHLRQVDAALRLVLGL
jgi:hypothetical protein